MNSILYRILLTVAIQGLKYLRSQQANLTNEQRAEMRAEEKKMYGKRWYEVRSEP